MVQLPGDLDVFVSLNVSAEREAQLDLTHAFYSTGLAIAVAPKADDGVMGTLKQIFTAKFAKLLTPRYESIFSASRPSTNSREQGPYRSS